MSGTSNVRFEHAAAELEQDKARALVQRLQVGVPPTGWALPFTVGRDDDLAELNELLMSDEHDDELPTVLVQGNYGAGKSHYLGVVAELAFEHNFAVARVTIDANGGVRFNRMDQIAGAVMRSIQLEPGGGVGIANLFDAIRSIDEDGLDANRWRLLRALRDDGKWRWHIAQRQGGFEAPGLHMALRAWCQSNDMEVRDTVVGWLNSPDEAQVEQRRLASQLIDRALPIGMEHRGTRDVLRDGTFKFRNQAYQQSWDAIADIDRLVFMCGKDGLVIVFDEVEDFVQNTKNRGHEGAALDNLFLFFGGRARTRGFFAVTPEFSFKCRERLAGPYCVYSDDDFDLLPRFQPAALSSEDFRELAVRIRTIHARAYSWDAEVAFDNDDIERCVTAFERDGAGERNRSFIKMVVDELNRLAD